MYHLGVKFGLNHPQLNTGDWGNPKKIKPLAEHINTLQPKTLQSILRGLYCIGGTSIKGGPYLGETLI